jgi:hypothetical protein
MAPAARPLFELGVTALAPRSAAALAFALALTLPAALIKPSQCRGRDDSVALAHSGQHVGELTLQPAACERRGKVIAASVLADGGLAHSHQKSNPAPRPLQRLH